MDYAPISNITTEVKWHPGGSDETLRTTFDIGGARAETLTSMDMPGTLYFDVVGTKGRVSLLGNDAFVSWNKESSLELDVAGEITIEKFAACDPYQLMADSMSRRIRGGQGWLMPHSDSIAFATAFDQIFAVMGRP